MLFRTVVALTFATLSIASAVPIVKRTSKSHWWSGLEPYDQYHQRYLALDCEDKHGTSFFKKCCHPRLKFSKIPEECLPSDDSCDDGDDGDNNNDNNNNNNNTPTSIVPMNVAPTPSSSSTTTSSTHKVSPTATPGGGDQQSGDVLTGNGHGTFFFQNGVAGACGTVHSDQDKVVALDAALYGNTGEQSKYCGKTIHITNTENGKTVTAKVADACPTCDGWGSVDMSVGAFTELATEAEGEINISWVLDLDS